MGNDIRKGRVGNLMGVALQNVEGSVETGSQRSNEMRIAGHKKNYSEIVESKSQMRRGGLGIPANNIFQVGGLKRHKATKSVFY